jgi:hypothetical protein
MNTYITNAAGIKFYIEQAGDFDNSGRACAGRGWFAGLVVGNSELGGVWFETKEAALDAIAAWKG